MMMMMMMMIMSALRFIPARTDSFVALPLFSVNAMSAGLRWSFSTSAPEDRSMTSFCQGNLERVLSLSSSVTPEDVSRASFSSTKINAGIDRTPRPICNTPLRRSAKGTVSHGMFARYSLNADSSWSKLTYTISTF